MMDILVTGATGFIGRQFVKRIAAHHRVTAIARQSQDHIPGVRWIPADLSTAFSTDEWPAKIDTVVHLAQSRRYRDFPSGADDVVQVNVHGTRRLLEYAKDADARRFVFASSGGVYGHHPERVTETHPLRPLDFYLGTKHLAELLVTAYRSAFTTVLLRPFFVYGPGQTGMLIPRLIDRVLGDQPIKVEGDPGIRINPIHIDDFLAAAERVLTLDDHAVLNICGDEVVHIRQLVETIGRASGRTPQILAGAPTATGDLVGDNHLMKDLLGVRPHVTLEDGLRSMLPPLAKELSR